MNESIADVSPSLQTPQNNTIERLILPDSLLSVSEIHDAIDAYFAAGLRPILVHAPVGEDGCTCGQAHKARGKHPIRKNWQHGASREELLDQLPRLKFTPNIGVVLGEQPSGRYLVAIDVDDADRAAQLESQLGALPPTPRCDSGRGYRLLYQIPPGVDTKQLSNVTGIGGEPGVDVKAAGGQVVVAPSLHPSGKRYAWTRVGEVGLLPMTWVLEILQPPPVPKWVREYTPKTMSADAKAKRRARAYIEKAVIGRCQQLAACGEGMRNDTLYRSTFAMLSLAAGLYVDREYWQWIQDELARAASACGLPDREVRATIASAEKGVRESGASWAPASMQEPSPSPSNSGASNTPSSLLSEGDPATEPPDDRVTIHVSNDLHKNVDEAVAALANDTNIYQREGRLVYITRITREDASPEFVEGSPQIREMEISTCRERLSRVAIFKARGAKGEERRILPTNAITSAVHARGEWPGIRPIIGVVEAPTMRTDGSIVQDAGYDPRTGYLYAPNDDFPAVRDDQATKENARWALGELAKVFQDFPYVSDAHRSVPIAAVLTIVARPAIAGSVPAFLFDASTRGSGKTLQTDAIATIATGRGAPRMNYTRNEEELEKILSGYALKGAPFICLDNVPTMRPFGGGPLDRVLTARDKVDLRVLGRSEVLSLSWRSVVMATGNNMSLYGDTARRVLMARLEPLDENPERRRNFTHDDLLAYVRSQRGRLVSAALLLLRAYFVSGCPDMGCERWGSFEEWSRIIPHAIVFAGGEDPMRARPARDEDVDAETQAIKCFITKVHEALGDAPFRLSDLLEQLFSGLQVPEHLKDLRDAIEELVPSKGRAPDARELGKRLGAFRGRVIDGLRIDSFAGHGGTMRWRITPV